MNKSTIVKAPTAQVNTTSLAITDDTVTVGQLHSATGTMAISETGSIQAEQLAIEQINSMGGVLGRKIKIIVEDGASDWPTFAEKAKKLLVNDKVASVFGCWTSASRKAVLPASAALSIFRTPAQPFIFRPKFLTSTFSRMRMVPRSI